MQHAITEAAGVERLGAGDLLGVHDVLMRDASTHGGRIRSSQNWLGGND